MIIFNTPQDKAQSIVAKKNIKNIISIYSPNTAFPLFPGVKSNQILRLCFNDISRPQNNLKAITNHDIIKIINFVRKRSESDFLVHCYAGVSRSIAITILILFLLEKDMSIDKLILKLKEKAPFANPNKLILQQAGKALRQESLFGNIIKNFQHNKHVIQASEFYIEI